MGHFHEGLARNIAQLCLSCIMHIVCYDLDNCMGGAGHNSAHYPATRLVWGNLEC